MKQNKENKERKEIVHEKKIGCRKNVIRERREKRNFKQWKTC